MRASPSIPFDTPVEQSALHIKSWLNLAKWVVLAPVLGADQSMIGAMLASRKCGFSER